ncbi:hypothetical protein JX265_000593 [Neoarthrinium moseri]|uniref:Mediator of RNA polymerase II transcription subunit 8 n=1 Tax=Neoarthrinium moseri TaxID=1658444 RepID=A0A9P9WYU6_9PEZI|nr:uncharacterized protein JN550_001653 [Neoarthrinium moseri]KAI1854189.1 hypothetical protein JX266_001330 [Neoarthrinium moseri]KAI1876157.1 hypothetical protein JN550_001653 [Neoarthrinium moseri]KAI1881767.1 hypothetical protein JX265_000593 [Neoarthrinium moseri]
MASLSLTQEELKAVEQTRQRLFQLSNSIGSLKSDVINSNPLPNLESLQASADILQQNMRSLLTITTQHNELFTRLAVHPSTNFPGRTQENILLQLLRKKPEPDVANAMDEGRRTYLENKDDLITVDGVTQSTGDDADDDDENTLPMNLRWEAIDAWIGRRAGKFIEEEFPEDFTAEELDLGIENVRTGLRRKFEEYEDDDEEDEDEEQEGSGAAKAAETAKQEDEDDIVMLDRPPPPPPAVPSLQTQASHPGGVEHTEGLNLDNILRVATLGQLPSRA